MVRDVGGLTSRTFDVLIVGGGIYGLTLAYDAADRGLSVALIERDDFGSGASFNHLRTIHGGLRYLQTLDLTRARESVRERRTLARIAPHVLEPLLFALPLYPSLTKGGMAMRAGFVLDRMVAWGRNRGLPDAFHLPGGRVVSRREALERFPGLRQDGLTGAAIWYDYVAAEADRLTISFALAAAGQQAVLANHLEAAALLVEGRRVVGVRAIDRMTGQGLEISARFTVNAAGGWVDALLQPLGLSARLPLLKAMNIVTRRPGGTVALGGRAASGRNLFLVPWRGSALFGTWESSQTTTSETPSVATGEVDAFVAELNGVFPSLDLTRADITLVHRGIVPAAVSRDGQLALEGHEQVRDHSREGIEGLLTVAGTKYTTARAVAERLTDRLLKRLQLPSRACRTMAVPLPGGDVDPASAIEQARREHGGSLPAGAIPHLVAAYGSRWSQVVAAGPAGSDGRRLVSDEAPVIEAELAWAVREEMAVTLVDAVVRRTPLGALGHPGKDAAKRAASILAAELGWSLERTAQELDALEAFYAPVGRHNGIGD